ncbi:DUF3089 domain-containing protein [Caulobacter sp. NIBR2454]|uniref:DUF3089 domain-containing protein n=1 Tax=Caulobacter sp. NIBR2454 TaxID=3015996 RepID=UPI0022B630FF|nr:DUF3089 domain-containing protein [Caulobacter sp. NIBR2454]
MARRGLGWGLLAGGLLLVALLAAAAFIWRDDILRTALDPKVPYQTYTAPPTPDYAKADAWALLPARPGEIAADAPAADVFFVHPTTYDGGGDWNAPVSKAQAGQMLANVMLPNYAGPFERVGRVFAPRYRQASLYTRLTLREDAREARRFAYQDVRAAFRQFVTAYNGDRPFILVGVEQGGELASRLLQEEIAPDPVLRGRLGGVYLIETVTPADLYGPGSLTPACQTRVQTGCVVAYATVQAGDREAGRMLLERAVVWNSVGDLVDLDGRPALCVNPLLGAQTDDAASERMNLGAANATGLEWGVRPAFLKRQASAQCQGGVLKVSKPRSDAFKSVGRWSDRKKVSGYNIFYADLEADAQARLDTWKLARLAQR